MPLKTVILDLPEEIVVDILKHLDLRQLLRCSQVCRRLNYTIKESLELQYRIELGADGLVDGVGCSLTTAERLTVLLQRRARWRYLHWTRVVSVPAPALCQAYELVDGVFASSMGSDFTGSRHLALTWLPTLAEPGRTIERKDVGVIIRDFAIDPSQDLMALVIADEVISFTVQLRTMSTNKPHPKAAKPDLYAPVPFQVGNSSIQIADDVIGAFFWVHGAGLVIWNWRTGKMVVNCIGFDLPTGTFDFAFISNRAFKITVASGHGSIELYTYSGNEEDSAASSSSYPHSPSIGRRLPTQVAVLGLPPTQLGQDVRRFLTHSPPFVANPTPGRPFETSRDSRIHMMTMSYGDHSGIFNMFVHNRFFMSLIPSGVGSGETFLPVNLHWDYWGPDNTRFMRWQAHFQWLRYVHGERVVFPPALDAHAGAMRVYDFKVHPSRTNDPMKSHLESEGREEVLQEQTTCYTIVTHEDILDVETVFQNPVISRLPYSESVRKGLPEIAEYSGYLIDQERLVGMRSGESGYVNLNVYTF